MSLNEKALKFFNLLKVITVILFSLFSTARADFYNGDAAKDIVGSSASCLKTDLRPYLGPVRNQGDIGWCYANAAADLLDFRFRNSLVKDGRPVQVSAIFVALNYTEKYSSSLVSESGIINLALTESMKNGFCDQTLENEAVKNGMKIGLKEKLAVLQNVKTLYDAGTVRGDYSQFEILMDKLRMNKSIVTAVPENDLKNILRASTPKNFIMNFAHMICNDSVSYRPPVLKPALVLPQMNWVNAANEVVRTEKHDIVQELSNQLTENNVVGITYNLNLLSDNSVYANSIHASVVVGRRFNFTKNRCEYLIRNSWGLDCTASVPRESSNNGGSNNVSNNGQKISRYLSRLQCENGNVWVAGEDFRKNLISITYLPE